VPIYSGGRNPCAQGNLSTGLPKDNGIPSGAQPDSSITPEEEGRSSVGNPREENQSVPTYSVWEVQPGGVWGNLRATDEATNKAKVTLAKQKK